MTTQQNLILYVKLNSEVFQFFFFLCFTNTNKFSCSKLCWPMDWDKLITEKVTCVRCSTTLCFPPLNNYKRNGKKKKKNQMLYRCITGSHNTLLYFNTLGNVSIFSYSLLTSTNTQEK